jgi:hypothetical protein
MSQYWEYAQNNSGGFWKLPAITVWVEADTEAEADSIAKENGVYFSYFSGKEGDCLECCGPRWSSAYWASQPAEPSSSDLAWAKESGIPAQLIIRGDK